MLCDAEVGVMIFSPRGKLHEFASPSMQKMLERHRDTNVQHRDTNDGHADEGLKGKVTNMEDRIKMLESTERKMMGEGLLTCSVKELNQLEVQVERGLRHIRAQKTEILMAQADQLKRKEVLLTEENEYLRKKIFTMDSIGLGSVQHIEVETQLDIRPPICIRSSSRE